MSAPDKLLLVYSLAFLSSCAAVTAPEGGPKDIEPPQLIKTDPISGSTNFKSKIIKLTFNEDVQPKDVNKELIISPNTGNTYQVKSNRREIILEFDKNLEENTTYRLDFRESIVDVTESNKALNVQLAFSTGAAIDSGKVKGTVMDYITNKPDNEIVVALYPESDTANIRKNPPYYFTKTASDGKYEMQNLRTGKYWIFAHNDKNGNQFYDQQNEKIGYISQPIQITDKITTQDLQTVLVDTKKPFIISTLNFTDKNTLKYNEGLQKLTFNTLEAKPKEIKLVTVAKPNGREYDIYAEKKNLPEKVLAFSIDSSFNEGIDTVNFKLIGKPGIQNLTYKIKSEDNTVQTGDKLIVTFYEPIEITKPQPFTIIEDTVKEIKPTYPKELTLNDNRTELTINYPIQAKKKVELKLDTTAITAINGQTFKSQKLVIPVKGVSKKTGTGSLSGRIKTNYQSYTLELLDDKRKAINTLQSPKNFQFLKLAPGTYTIEVKIDGNNNGKWEIGDKTLKKSPEKLYIYPKTLTVRANWDIEDILLEF